MITDPSAAALNRIANQLEQRSRAQSVQAEAVRLLLRRLCEGVERLATATEQEETISARIDRLEPIYDDLEREW